MSVARRTPLGAPHASRAASESAFHLRPEGFAPTPTLTLTLTPRVSAFRLVGRRPRCSWQCRRWGSTRSHEASFAGAFVPPPPASPPAPPTPPPAPPSLPRVRAAPGVHLGKSLRPPRRHRSPLPDVPYRRALPDHPAAPPRPPRARGALPRPAGARWEPPRSRPAR